MEFGGRPGPRIRGDSCTHESPASFSKKIWKIPLGSPLYAALLKGRQGGWLSETGFPEVAVARTSRRRYRVASRPTPAPVTRRPTTTRRSTDRAGAKTLPPLSISDFSRQSF
jgi:hypothetical protein